MINDLWISALSAHLPVNLTQRGISDICYGEKKVAGTSIFRKKHLLVYQGSMLVDVDLSRIGSLLNHPSREPDYRHGRSHTDFLTTLCQLGCKDSAEVLAVSCQNYFNHHLAQVFQKEFYHG